jgi:hypothetical protein
LGCEKTAAAKGEFCRAGGLFEHVARSQNKNTQNAGKVPQALSRNANQMGNSAMNAQTFLALALAKV